MTTRQSLSVCMCSMMMFLGGCYACREDINDCIMEKRLKHQAYSAWRECESMYNHVECRSDFQDGFEAGYLDVAHGGDGRRPILPPGRYRTWCYQNNMGGPEAMRWMDGFSQGAIYADQNGVGYQNRAVTTVPPRPRKAPPKAPPTHQLPEELAPSPLDFPTGEMPDVPPAATDETGF